MNSFLNRISEFARAEHLLDCGRTYLAALSGGADSVALLLAMKRLGYATEAVHCNFRLRGKEADRDEEFCRRLCEREGVRLHVAHFDTREYAALHGISIEMAARKLRYSYFEQLRTDTGADGICIGHHMEDSVETFLLNAIRGTGIKGLAGIAAKNGRVVRPMLCVTRSDIEKFLADNGQDYITDSSNLVDDVKRNKIRLDVMPAIRKISAAADRKIFETARRVSEANKVFVHALDEAAADVTTTCGGYMHVDIERLKRQVSPEYTLFHILSRYGFSSAAVDSIYAGLDRLKAGSVFASDSHRMAYDRGCLVVELTEQRPMERPLVIPECGTYVAGGIRVKAGIETVSPGFKPSRQPFTATVDAARATFPLKIRRWEKGDRFSPFGMKGTKLVSDCLTDRKMPFFEKERQLVMTGADGRILWLVGLCIDNGARIGKRTSDVLTIEVDAANNS